MEAIEAAVEAMAEAEEVNNKIFFVIKYYE
jgi:hypothetical protein